MSTNEEYYLGQTAELSKKFTYEDVILFSVLSLDDNPVHLDAKFAANTIFKKQIVHGLLIGSLISAVIGKTLPGSGAIYLHQEMNFKKPVFIGEEITAIVTIIEMKLEKSILILSTKCININREIVLDGKAVVKYQNINKDESLV